MCKITITSQLTEKDDGVGVTVSYSHDKVEDIQELAWVFAEAARAMGYTYVESVTLSTECGKNYKSDF